MNSLRPLLLLAAGSILAVFGAVWVWTGLDIVQVERGWSTVIAGSAMLSAGLIIVALAAILSRLEHIVATLAPRRTSPEPPPGTDTAASPDVGTAPSETINVPSDLAARDQKAIVGRHSSGDTTYVMFADGSVEAQTPDGVVTFDSLDALRVFAEEREALHDRA